jgi:hypothetical protein
VLNQIGRRLTEKLDGGNRHRLLLMLDEFPALGRLDFFESALAFMVGYGLKSFLIAQSLNQIEKAYGPNNAILDNCHVRIAFATNDERTARRVSDALGTTTEQRAMNNYAGHRLSPWLGHIMVSRQETARPLLTSGEVMQLPPADELVLISGIPPIRARKARYFEDRRFARRILAPPALLPPRADSAGGRPVSRANDWTPLVGENPDTATGDESAATSLVGHDRANGGVRREPGLPGHEAVAPEEPKRESTASPTMPMTQRSCRRISIHSFVPRPAGRRSIVAMALPCEEPMKRRLSVYLEPALMMMLTELARRRRRSLSIVAEAAIASFLTPDDADRREAAITRRLDRLTRQADRLERHLGVSVEAMALFIRYWLTVTPSIPQDLQAVVQADGRDRFAAFLEMLGQRLATGTKVFQEIVNDVEFNPPASPASQK